MLPREPKGRAGREGQGSQTRKGHKSAGSKKGAFPHRVGEMARHQRGWWEWLPAASSSNIWLSLMPF